jgi:tetratricopeptide (TPR) repeat protein
LIFYSSLTIIRNSAWKSDASLWKDMLNHYPSSYLVYYNLGLSYTKVGALDAAIPLLEEAARLKPGYYQAYRSLGLCYLSKRMPDRAIGEFKQSLKLAPYSADIYNDIGISYAMMNDFGEARKMWLEALRISPGHKNAKNNLNQLNNPAIYNISQGDGINEAVK